MPEPVSQPGSAAGCSPAGPVSPTGNVDRTPSGSEPPGQRGRREPCPVASLDPAEDTEPEYCPDQHQWCRGPGALANPEAVGLPGPGPQPDRHARGSGTGRLGQPGAVDLSGSVRQ